MESAILNSYWKVFHEEKVKNYKEMLRRMDMIEKVLFLMTLLFGFVALIVDMLIAFKVVQSLIGVIIMLLSMIVEFLGIIASNRYSVEKSIKRVFQEVRDIKAGFSEVYKWLKEIGFVKKAEIKQLTFRCERLLEEWEKEKKNSRDNVEKVVTLFYIPTLLAIVSWILSWNDGKQDVGEFVLFVIMITTFGAAIYFIIWGILDVIEKISYSNLKKLKYMLRDFNGVLDYCFDSEDYEIEILN